MAETAAEQLTGKSLLQKIKISNLPKRELAKECGYYSVSKDGEVRVNIGDFYDAVLAAKGIALEPKSEKEGRGREATYRVTVHQNGQIVIGSSYTESMGLKPGDEFEIKLGHKHIRLIQIDDNKSGVEEDKK